MSSFRPDIGYYNILGVKPDDEFQTIKEAFHQYMIKHPESCYLLSDTRLKLKNICEWYEKIIEKNNEDLRRQLYDKKRQRNKDNGLQYLS